MPYHKKLYHVFSVYTIFLTICGSHVQMYETQLIKKMCIFLKGCVNEYHKVLTNNTITANFSAFWQLLTTFDNFFLSLSLNFLTFLFIFVLSETQKKEILTSTVECC